MDISPLEPRINVGEIPLEQLAANPKVPEKEKVGEAARQFEAILLRQIIGEARKTVIKTPGEDDSNEKEIYNDMVNNEMADSISRSGSFGLAKTLESRLVRQTLHQGGEQPAPVAPLRLKSTHH